MEEYVTVAEARARLGISKVKIAALIKAGTLRTVPNALDARQKMIRVSDLKKLTAGQNRAAVRPHKEKAAPVQPAAATAQDAQ